MEHVYISRKGDREAVRGLINDLNNLNDSELIQRYNRQVEIGIVGVHRQALSIIALHLSFLDRFSSSPIEIEDGVLIKLGSKL